jgi:hypothetical protein
MEVSVFSSRLYRGGQMIGSTFGQLAELLSLVSQVILGGIRVILCLIFGLLSSGMRLIQRSISPVS